MTFENSLEFARSKDKNDVLSEYRNDFHIPQHNGNNTIYLCGNSLGLQPKSTKEYIGNILEKWANEGVEGHFNGEDRWVDQHRWSKKTLSALVGGSAHEVIAMNNLTTNLHLMLASFYQPKGKRVKVLIESGAFPSDHFAITTHMQMKGVSPQEHLVELVIPEDGYLSNDVICENIEELGDELALVLLPGIQYYTGQFFDISRIAKAGHIAGATVGFDLAHAAGNVKLSLHANNVDFAVWCSYKYLNSGPGNLSGVFVHEKHGLDLSTPRLGGWWGQDETIRFEMENIFSPMKGADGWMLSTPNAMAASAHQSSLDMIEKAGFENMLSKSRLLTGFLEFLLNRNEFANENVKCLTPSNPEERGSQLSLYLPHHGKEVFDYLIDSGVILDWREPNVIRVAPVPLYNSFEDVWRFNQLLISGIQASSNS